MKTENTLLSRITIVLLFVLAGCGTTQIPYVSPTLPERNCTFKIAGTLTIKQFDGQNVEWKPNLMDAWAVVQLAEGSHTFVVDYEKSETQQYPDQAHRSSSGNWYHSPGGMRTETHSQKGITIKYDHFLAGHTYELMAAEEFEGSGGLSGLFSGGLSGVLGAVHSGESQALRVGIRDVTNNQNGKIEWL